MAIKRSKEFSRFVYLAHAAFSLVLAFSFSARSMEAPDSAAGNETPSVLTENPAALVTVKPIQSLWLVSTSQLSGGADGNATLLKTLRQ